MVPREMTKNVNFFVSFYLKMCFIYLSLVFAKTFGLVVGEIINYGNFEKSCMD